MARRGRKPSATPVDDKSFSFKLDNNDPRERELRAYIEEQNKNDDWSLRHYIVNMWHFHHGHIPDQTKEVASAIREATQGLWDMFNELMQNRGAPLSRENFQRFAQDQGVDEFDEDFVTGMLDTFGKLDDE